MRGAVSHPFLLQFCSLLQGRSCLWTVSISTQINCLQKFYGKRAFRACGEKAKRRADVNRFFVAGAERNVLSCSKRQVYAVFFVFLLQAVQSFAKTCFAYMGDLSGLLLCKQMKKAKRKKLLQKSHREQKPCYVRAFLEQKKGFFKKFCRLFCQRLQEKAVFGIMF